MRFPTDQIALPDFNAGAMENWGLITYRETALLYDATFSSNSNKERVATIIAHELAHMVSRGTTLRGTGREARADLWPPAPSGSATW